MGATKLPKSTTGSIGPAGPSSNSLKTSAKTPSTAPTSRKSTATDTRGPTPTRPPSSRKTESAVSESSTYGHTLATSATFTHNLTTHEGVTHDQLTTVGDLLTSSTRRDEREDNATDSQDLGSKRYISFAKRGLFPYIVSVQFALDESSEHRCGGAIVHSQWVLTSARCVSLAGAGCTSILVMTRGDNTTGTSRVSRVVFHDQQSSESGAPGQYGIALLKLESPLDLSDNIKSIPLAPPGSSLDGPLGLVSWSRSDIGELHNTKLKASRPESCRDVGPQAAIPADALCALPVGPSAGPGRCYYDIGGLLIAEGEHPQLVGLLTSWYLPCDTRRPAVFARLSDLAGWVLNNTDREPTPTPTLPIIPTTPASVPRAPQDTLLNGVQGGPSVTSSKKPKTVSSALAPGKNSISNSGSSDSLDSSRAFSTATSSVEPGYSAQSETVSVGSAVCQRDTGALSLTYSLSFANVTSGSSISSSNVNASCVEGVNSVQSLGWSVSSSNATPFDVKAVVQMHLDAISGLLRQSTLLYV